MQALLIDCLHIMSSLMTANHFDKQRPQTHVCICVQGVMYSHRSNFLHAMVVASGDVMGLSSTSCFYAIVPLFHANSWGLVFAAPMTGTRLVLPGLSLPPLTSHQLS